MSRLLIVSNKLASWLNSFTASHWVARKTSNIRLNLCNLCAVEVIVDTSRVELFAFLVGLKIYDGSYYRIADLKQRGIGFEKGLNRAFRCENCNSLMNSDRHLRGGRLKICYPCGFICYTSHSRALKQFKTGTAILKKLESFTVKSRNFGQIRLYCTRDVEKAGEKRKLDLEEARIAKERRKKIKLK